MCSISSSVICLTTFPGLPRTNDLSGITLFSVTKAFAPIIQFFPILVLFNIVEPIPIKQQVLMEQQLQAQEVELSTQLW